MSTRVSNRALLVAAAVVLGIAGCRELNPAFMGGSQLSASGSETDPTMGATTQDSTDPSTSSASASASTSSPSTTDPATTAPSDGSETTDPTDATTSTPGTCGDGVVDADEDCDDMNADNTDACLDTCVAASCGDGFVQAGVEDCEGTVGDATCEALGEPGGGITCDDACTLDASTCACGNDRVPVGGTCPPECTGGCDGTTCTIECFGNGACDDESVACPPGWDCDVVCSGNGACDGATIACTDNACTIGCSGNWGCRNARIECGEGTCAVDCGNGNSVCDGLELVCGANDSTVTCNGNDDVLLTPYAGSSCACEQSGC